MTVGREFLQAQQAESIDTNDVVVEGQSGREILPT